MDVRVVCPQSVMTMLLTQPRWSIGRHGHVNASERCKKKEWSWRQCRLCYEEKQIREEAIGEQAICQSEDGSQKSTEAGACQSKASSHLHTDGSLFGVSGSWSADGWSVVCLLMFLLFLFRIRLWTLCVSWVSRFPILKCTNRRLFSFQKACHQCHIGTRAAQEIEKWKGHRSQLCQRRSGTDPRRKVHRTTSSACVSSTSTRRNPATRGEGDGHERPATSAGEDRREPAMECTRTYAHEDDGELHEEQ